MRACDETIHRLVGTSLAECHLPLETVREGPPIAGGVTSHVWTRAPSRTLASPPRLDWRFITLSSQCSRFPMNRLRRPVSLKGRCVFMHSRMLCHCVVVVPCELSVTGVSSCDADQS